MPTELADMIDDLFFIQDSVIERGNFARRIFRKHKIEYSMTSCTHEALHYLYEYQHEADNCTYEKTLAYLNKYKKSNILQKLYRRVTIK